MAYSLETSSVKTIVPGAEVSGFCDVVARQKISELSGEVPQLSAGEGIAITTVDGKTVITNNISAGSNISLVYDMETNTYRIDGQGGVDPASAVLSESAIMPTLGLSYWSGVKISGGNETLYFKTLASYNTYISAVSLNGPYVTYLTGDSDVPTDLHPVTSEHWNNIITATKEVSDKSWNWNSTFNTVKTNSASWSSTELPSAISAWSFNNFSQSYSHTPGNLFTETYTGSLFAPSSQWGGGPDSKPKLLLDTTVENYSGTSWVYEHGITSTGHRTTRLEDNMLYINSAIESDTIAGQVYTMVEPDFIRLFGSKPNETTKLIELGSSGVAISTSESATWSQIISAANGAGGGGKTYTGVAPIQVNNTTDEISITGESLSAGPGIDMFSSGGYVVVSSTGKELSAGPGIDLFESGGYFVISSNGAGGSTFPITGTNGTTGFTANMDCSSMYLSTGAGPAGAIVHFDTKGVHFEAYPSTDVSASWFNLITQYNNATCSAVKLTTAASETRFVTSSLPNLNEITFIAPSYGPYETYSALIDDGETTFVAEVDSGCCVKVVRNWNDDRNKNCWCGLNQETYFYIG